jgi:RNA polymerase sigma factor for flagellar operon FliA
MAATDLDGLPPYPGLALADITLVGSEADAAAAARALLAADAVGFDSEAKPTFAKGEASTGPHLVQLATDDRAWLFPTSLAAGLPVLKAVLESRQVRKAGFGLGNDRSQLRARFGIEFANVVDLGEKLRGPEHRGTVGAKTAVARFFGQRLQKSKKTGTSNWASPRLTEAQLRYAANDAHVALRVYRAWLAAGGG